MDCFPIFLNLKGRSCLVVGGGKVAMRKVEKLLRAGACVTVVAPSICTAFQNLQHSSATPLAITHHARCFTDADIDQHHLIVAATNDTTTNLHIAALAQANQQLVNVVDAPEQGNFIFPSIVDRSPVIVAISTGGSSPVLARQLRTRLECVLPSGCGELASITEAYRETVKQHLPEAQRKAFWEHALNSQIEN